MPSPTAEEHRAPVPARKPRNPRSKPTDHPNTSSPPAAGIPDPTGRRIPAERTPKLNQDEESRPSGPDELSQPPDPADGSANPEEQRMPMTRPQRRSMEKRNSHPKIDDFMPVRQSNPPRSGAKIQRTGTIPTGRYDLPPASTAKSLPQSRPTAINRRAPPSGDSAAAYCDGTNCEWRPKSFRIANELAALRDKLMESEKELAATQDELMETERELAATQDELMEAEAEIRSLKMLGPQSDAA